MTNEESTLRKALEAITHLWHHPACNYRVAVTGEARGTCTCHVGIAALALTSWSQEPKPVEHVAVVRPDEPGTVHFEPPLACPAGTSIGRMDVCNNADGSITFTTLTTTTLPHTEEREPDSGAIGIAQADIDRCAQAVFPKMRVAARRWPSHPDYLVERILAEGLVREMLLDLAGNRHTVVLVNRDLVKHYRATCDLASRKAQNLPALAAVYETQRAEAALTVADAVVAASGTGCSTSGTPDGFAGDVPVDHKTSGGLIVPPPVDPRAVDVVLVDRYRQAAAGAARERRWAPTGTPSPGTQEAVIEYATMLADDVLRRADAIIPADASLLAQLCTLTHSAVYTLGNPMSGLGGNTTVRAALESLREAEVLLEERST